MHKSTVSCINVLLSLPTVTHHIVHNPSVFKSKNCRIQHFKKHITSTWELQCVNTHLLNKNKPLSLLHPYLKTLQFNKPYGYIYWKLPLYPLLNNSKTCKIRCYDNSVNLILPIDWSIQAYVVALISKVIWMGLWTLIISASWLQKWTVWKKWVFRWFCK